MPQLQDELPQLLLTRVVWREWVCMEGSRKSGGSMSYEQRGRTVAVMASILLNVLGEC